MLKLFRWKRIEWTGGGILVRVNTVEFASRLRRFLGLFFLLSALVEVILGQTWLVSFLEGRTFLWYWFSCFVFTGLSMIMALLELRAIRKSAKKEHRELMSNVLNEHEPLE